ncbi:ComF family protein [Roseibium hamelinense]|uniref:ComF family protein n=1 Tax=Roseibium hamelinense TaxID=150831 RepID=UPI001FCB7BB1|nr:ComF family protein [Roseibium hamelinense]
MSSWARDLRYKCVGLLTSASKSSLDFLLPPRCLICSAATDRGGAYCPNCWKDLPLIERPFCEQLGIPFVHHMGAGALSPKAISDPPLFARSRSATLFSGSARECVHKLKYGRRRELAKPMAEMMVRAGKDILQERSIIIPVPLHWTRLVERRFNQAADLANEIAAYTGYPIEISGLQRTRRTQNQVGLTGKERAKNVRGAFRVKAASAPVISSQRVLLVDDVFTTGSTVRTCVRALLSAGASSVDVLTFSMADTTANQTNLP